MGNSIATSDYLHIIAFADVHDTADPHVRELLDSYKDFRERTANVQAILTMGDIAWEVYSRIMEFCKGQELPFYSIAGNHDDYDIPPFCNLHMKERRLYFAKRKTLMERLYSPVTRSSTGIILAGYYGCRQYKEKQKYVASDFEVERSMKLISPVDIFVAHAPPENIHDDPGDMIHKGFKGFSDYIQQGKTRIFLHGHVHKNCETMVGSTRVIAVHGVGHVEISVREIP